MQNFLQQENSFNLLRNVEEDDTDNNLEEGEVSLFIDHVANLSTKLQLVNNCKTREVIPSTKKGNKYSNNRLRFSVAVASKVHPKNHFLDD